MMYVLLRALLCALGLGVAGVIAGMVVLSGERCGGPACAGLAVIPMAFGVAGAGAGFVLGAIGFWILRGRRRPLVVPEAAEP
jgi:hypothetical protein